MSESHELSPDEVLLRALDRPPMERRAFLRRLCQDDAELLAEVESLLEAYEGRGPMRPPSLSRALREVVSGNALDPLRSTPSRETPPAAARLEEKAHGSRQMIGPFQLQESLGAGGMGVVYKAYDPRLQRSVALKFLAPAGRQDPTASQRQLREARAAGALNHPHIATIYEIGESDDGPFIAMELVEGESLADGLQKGRLPLGLALEWSLQLCDAIASAHDIGIIHRDIKPANIMIAQNGRVKVLDFGLAVQNMTSESGELHANARRLTATGKIIGTIDFMAPEVFRGENATAASDVFSLGVVLYAMLGGRLPFDGGPPARVIYEITHVDPPALTDVRDEVPAELAAVVQRALAKEPPDRYRSARDLLTALRAACGARVQSVITAKPRGTPAPSVPGNLPEPTTTFIGREDLIDALEQRLDESRLLTITGPGGAGKTRISIELARRVRRRFPLGVYLIELGPLTEAPQVVRSIAGTLGVREEPGRPLIDTVIEFLSERQNVLLLLDNCEHLIAPSVEAVRAILEAVPELKVLATSQERLGLPSETVVQVSTMALPPTGARSASEVADFEAVELFLERAKQVKLDFELNDSNAAVISQICRQLDGIPLAIELAAGRVQLVPPAKLLDRLEDRFRVLRGNRTSLPRQQTLRATVEWSLDLLSDLERAVFFTLSAFSDGMSLEAVERVCACACDADSILDQLGRLVDKSLVIARETPDGEPRYHLLETLREYGTVGLRESGNDHDVRQRHATFFHELVLEAEPELTGADQAMWLDRLDLESRNIESAIRWSARQQPELALEMAAAFWRFWFVRGYLGTGRDLLTRALGASTGVPEVRARALQGAGVLANDQGDSDAARAYFEECLQLRRELGDRQGEAQTLNSLGIAARDQGDYVTARRLLEEGLQISGTIGDEPGMAMSIHALDITAHREDQCEKARTMFETGLRLREKLADRRGIAALKAHLGSVDYDLGKYDQAKTLLQEALATFRALENKRGIAFALMYLGGAARARGDYDTSWAHHTQALTISRQLGDKQHLAQSLEWLARLAAAREQFSVFLEIEAATVAFRERFRLPRTPIESAALEEDRTRAERALAAKEVEQARSAGRARSLDSVIALALQRP